MGFVKRELARQLGVIAQKNPGYRQADKAAEQLTQMTACLSHGDIHNFAQGFMKGGVGRLSVPLR